MESNLCPPPIAFNIHTFLNAGKALFVSLYIPLIFFHYITNIGTLQKVWRIDKKQNFTHFHITPASILGQFSQCICWLIKIVVGIGMIVTVIIQKKKLRLRG